MSESGSPIRTGFTKVKNKIITSKKITPTEKLIIICLLMHSFDKDYCFPSFKKISDELGFHRNTVDNAIQSLVGKRFIRVKKSKGKVNRYYLSSK